MTRRPPMSPRPPRRRCLLAPSSLTATTVSPSRIDLAWTDNAKKEAGFKLERSTDGVNFTQIVQLGANAKSYSKGLSARTTYYYRVRAYDGPQPLGLLERGLGDDAVALQDPGEEPVTDSGGIILVGRV